MLRRTRTALFVIALSMPTGLYAQVRPVRRINAAAEAGAATSREQDGLTGPVRRVRTEVSKITLKGGELIEGPRRLLAVALYDRSGRKTDGENYPTDDAPAPGKEETYKYDERGNIVEMRVLDASGSLVGQEVYSYEFDAVGNWTVMKTSVAVLEGDTLSYEPTEVTYRTITYYLTDTVARGLRPADGSATKPSHSRAEATTTAGRGADSGPARRAPMDSAVNASLTTASPVASEAASRTKPVVTPGETAAAGANGNGTEANPAPPSSPTLVKEVSGEELRRAATHLPEPEYPSAALNAAAAGVVEVQVIVDERGEVTSTRVMSGHALLADAAERAARRARFSPSKLSNEPAVVFGVLSYNFERPAPTAALPSNVRDAAPARVAASEPERTAEVPAAVPPAAQPEAGNAAPESSPRAAPSAAGLTSVEFLKNGTDLMEAGRFGDAVKLLKTAARLDPENQQVLYRLGESYISMRLYQEASDAFRKLTKLAPEQSEAHYYLGNASYALGRYRESVKSFQQAVRLKSGVAQYHFGLGVAHLAVGEPSSARKQVKILSGLNARLAAELDGAVRAFDATGAIHTGNILERVAR